MNISRDLAEIVVQLQKKHLIFEDRHYQCFCAYGRELGSLMKVIGEERSRSFQALSMCNGVECDLDRFDPHYLQVILWDDQQKQVIGGYRIALVEDFVKENGWNSLYLNEDYYPLENLLMPDGKTFELSRAFISLPYQGKTLSLYLLWKGVWQLFSKFPEYRYTVGSASISQQKTDEKTLKLLIAGLRYGPAASNAYLIKARHPYEEDFTLPEHLLLTCKKGLSFDELNAFISTETHIPFKVPQLLRYYTEHFSARCLAYAIDEKFGSIDILEHGTLNKVSDTWQKYISRGQ